MGSDFAPRRDLPPGGDDADRPLDADEQAIVQMFVDLIVAAIRDQQAADAERKPTTCAERKTG